MPQTPTCTCNPISARDVCGHCGGAGKRCTCNPVSSRDVCANCGGAGKPWLSLADAALAEAEAATGSGLRHPLIGRERWEAWRELMNSHGNAFAIGGAGGAAGGVVALAWDFLARPLGRPEVANLIGWLVMISEVTAADIEPICQAQGVSLRTALDLDVSRGEYCSACGHANGCPGHPDTGT